jgi:hypothetical protein
MITNLLIIGGAVLGNMLLIFGLLLRPRNEAALWVGLLHHTVSSSQLRTISGAM